MSDGIRRITASLAFAVLVLSVMVCAAWAQEQPGEDKPALPGDKLPAFPLCDSESFARADFDSLLEKAAAFVEENPDSPQAELVMKLIGSYSGRIRNYDEFEPVLERVLEKDLANGFNESMYRSALARFYQKRGLTKKARQVETAGEYVLDCLILGPFGSSYRACLDKVYQPEKDLFGKEAADGLVDREYAGTDEFRKISWKKYPVEEPVTSPRVNPFNYLQPSGGCAYVLVQLKAQEDRPALIDIEAGSYFKIWLNGSLVLSANASVRREPASHIIPINLVKGYNHILLKLPGSSFSLAIRDTQGHFLRDVEFEKGLKIHPVSKSEPAIYEGEYTGRAIKHYTELLREKPSDAMARIAYSYLLAREGLDVDALEEAQEALEQAPEDLFVCFNASLRYLEAPHYPRATSRNKARELWNSILEKDPDFVPAREKIARYMMDDDKHEDAVKELEKIFEKGLDNLGSRKLMLDIFSSMKWEREIIEQVRHIEKLQPHSEWLYNWWARYYSKLGNVQKAWEYVTKADELDKSGIWYLNRRASRLEMRGKLEEALELYHEIIRLRPSYYWAVYNIADIYRKQGKYEEAIVQRRKLLEIHPEDPDNYRIIGDIYREWGKNEHALDYYGKCLVLEPGNWSLRRYVQYLKGESEDFWKDYAISDEEAMELVRNAPGKEAYPKSSNLTVLNEEITAMMPDGSKSTYVHMIYKVLDVSGKDKHATPYVSGELIELRSIQPDGTVLEPTSVQGSFTMPSMKEGVFIEYKFRADSGWGRSNRPDYQSENWFFQDEGYDEPVTKCRKVVVVAKKPSDKDTTDFLARFGRSTWSVMDFSELKQNLVKEKGVKFEKTENEKSIIYSWMSENMPRIEPEPYMPPRDKVLPNAYFISRRTWDDFAETLAERTYMSGTIPTKLVRQKAVEIAGDAQTQYEQVEALYGWCMANIKGGWGSDEAHTVLMEESGNRDTLFVSFLIALGIDYDVVLVGPDPLTELDIEWDIPRSHYFGGSLLRVKPEGSEPVFVTLDTRYMPIGKIPGRLQGGPIYVPGEGITGKSMSREQIDDRADRMFFKVNVPGLSCEAKLEFPSVQSYGRKEYFKDLPSAEVKQSVERYANNYFPGAVLKSFNLPELEKIGRMFEIDFNCETPNFITRKKDGAIIAETGLQPLEMQQRYAEKTERKFDMLLGGWNLDRCEVSVDLGDKYESVQLPASVNLRNDFGTYVLTFSQSGSVINIKRRFTLLPQRVTVARYKEFVEFCKKIDESELGRIILKEKETEKPEPPGDKEEEKESKPEDKPEDK